MFSVNGKSNAQKRTETVLIDCEKKSFNRECSETTQDYHKNKLMRGEVQFVIVCKQLSSRSYPSECNSIFRYLLELLYLL